VQKKKGRGIYARGLVKIDLVVNSYETGGRASAATHQRQFAQAFRVIEVLILLFN
jgi:hypothetical protein